MFVRNILIFKIFFKTSNHCYQLKYRESSINNNIAFSSEKVVLSVSGEKYVQIKHRLQAKTVPKKYIC